ncbi:MAG: hypothetical protein J6Q61_01400 [Bacteroidales bacterium]|nr:hypothetical protein [Bacteroidales bacterium]
MKDFHFTSDKEQAEIEEILLQRKKKQNKQQALFASIFALVILIVVLYCIRKVVYIDFNGYVVVHNVRFRASEDIFVYDIYKHNGDLIKPGDTIYSYLSLDWFHELGNINTESEIIVNSRDLKLQYGLAYQNLAVLQAKKQEIKRQIALEDHNIRFGLSDNAYKLQLERDYKETEEELKALQRRLQVMRKTIEESQEAVDRLSEVSAGFTIQNIRNKKKMKNMGLIHYVVAADSGLVTRNWISEYSLVLRGEDVIETQSFDLEKDNVYIMAYVTPDKAKYINRGFKANVIVNDDVEYTATVVSMGARTEPIPEAYRNNLSKNHTAAIAVLRIDPGQKIPFWSLVNGMPVLIRFNNRDYKDVKSDEYMQLKTPKGLDVPEELKDQLYFNSRGRE